jgi:hypothetical protein
MRCVDSGGLMARDLGRNSKSEREGLSGLVVGTCQFADRRVVDGSGIARGASPSPEEHPVLRHRPAGP